MVLEVSEALVAIGSVGRLNDFITGTYGAWDRNVAKMSIVESSFLVTLAS